MKTHLIMTVALFSRVLTGSPAHAQAAAPPAHADPAMAAFFTGHWKGEGAFAGGRTIAAEVSFQPTLDSAWLLYEHRDLPPASPAAGLRRPQGIYKATSLWGVDPRTGQFIAYTFDNFHGHRQWLSSGWAAGRLVLSTGGYSAPAGTVFEHFIYERLSDNQFKMTYETSRDGVEWRLGDWVIFTRS
jgi:hypothetical protein